MAEGAWAPPAQVSYLIYQANRSEGSPNLGLEEFNPLTRGKAPRRKPDIELDGKEGIAFLKRLTEGGVFNGG